jgi:hypothetical protein
MAKRLPNDALDGLTGAVLIGVLVGAFVGLVTCVLTVRSLITSRD